jgi:putative ABC transport system permease protein
MDEISKQLESEGRRFQDRGVNVVRLDREVVSESRQGLLIAFGAVGCVLLIACANLAGLLLAHTRAREKEIAIRTALGATRKRIVVQFLTECLVLAGIGGVSGLFVATWIARAFVLLQPGDIPRVEEVNTDATVLLFGVALSAVTGILFGLLPAVQSSRVNFAGSLQRTPQKSGRGAFGLNPRRVLLIFEVGLTVMLLIGTGLLLRSFALLKSVNPGFQTEGLLAMMIPLPETSYAAPKAQAEFARELLERTEGIPTVESAAVSNSLPMQNRYLLGARLGIEGRQLPEDTSIAVRAVSLNYFGTMRIPLLRGRDFLAADEGKEDTAIVNRETAERFWAGSDPIGQRLVLDKGKPRTIVGVVANVRSSSPDADSEIEVYLPFAEQPAPYIGLVLRSPGDLRPLEDAVSAVVRGIDPNQPVTEVASMRKTLADFFDRPRFNLVLLGCFAALALTLSIIGIYAVISHSVTQRTNEIGIRIALGAQRRSVLILFMRDGAFVAVTGISLGLIGALATTRLLAALLFGIPPQDATTFAAVSLIFLVVCLSASYFPARRAMKVDPIIALRHE